MTVNLQQPLMCYFGLYEVAPVYAMKAYWRELSYCYPHSLTLRLVTGWTVRGSNPDGGEIFLTRPERQWGPTQHHVQWVLVFFLGGKAAGPVPSSAEVKERVELYLCSPSGPSWPVLG
jgi:hypothetical protein